jgi:hypothetical protein
MLGSSGIGKVPARRRRSMVDREVRRIRATSSINNTWEVISDPTSVIRSTRLLSVAASILRPFGEPRGPSPIPP